MKDVNVPDGYKSTDVGVIPKDWEEYYLTELGILERGKSKHRPRWAEHLYGGNYPFIQTGEITAANKYVTNYNKTYSEAGLAQSKLWSKDTLCITIAANIAETAILKFPACFPDSILGFVPSSKKANIEFVFYTINYLQQSIKELVISSAQDNINLGTFQKIKFPLPPLPEQKAIARVLSDVDELIRECDRTIAKKRDIKQGTMQQLLTGKKRLPGFSGEWEKKTLEEVADNKIKWSISGGPFGSNLKSSDYTTDGIRIIQLQNIGDGIFYDDYKIYTSEAKANELISCNIYSGEIILSKMGDPVARACFIPGLNQRYLMCSDGIRFVVNKNRFDKKFVHDYINSKYFRNKAIDSSTGSTRMRIGLQDLKKLALIAPTLAEQKAIAEILSDMDAEIEVLEQKRDKYKAIKQGMMQELLTGKTRIKGLTR